MLRGLKNINQSLDAKLKGSEFLMMDLYEEKQVVNEIEIKLKELGNSL